MAGRERMTIEEVVRKVLRDEHARCDPRVGEDDRARDDGGRGCRADRRRARRAPARGPSDASQRLSAAGAGTRGPGRSSCRSPSCARAATSPASCSRASAPSRRWCRWSSRPMCAGSRPGGSISSSRASGCASARARSAGSPGCSTSRSRRSGGARWRAATRICSSTPRSRRSVTAAGWPASAWSSRTPCMRPGGARSSVSTSARPRPRRSGASSCAASSLAAWSACSWPSVTRTRG